MDERVLVTVAIATGVLIASVLVRAAVRHRHGVGVFELEDLGGPAEGRAVVVFSSPFCHGCTEWRRELDARGVEVIAIDVSSRADIARKYRVRSTPWVAVVDRADGIVVREFDHYSPRHSDLLAVSRLTGRD